MSRVVSLGFIRNTLRERIIARLTQTHRGFRYVATETPLSPDVTVLDTRPITDPLPEPTSQLSAYRATTRKSVMVLQDAIVDTITNYVYDRDLKLIGESTSWNLDHAVARFPARPRAPREVLAGTIVHLGTDAYYHWLIEEVPAYLQARAARPEAQTIVRQAPPGYVTDLLQLIGVTPRQTDLSVRVESLVFASRGAAVVPNRIDLATLHDLRDSLELVPSSRRRIYISRRDSGRFPQNEDAVERTVVAAGCEVIQLTGMTLTDQMSLFADAELVVGTHGAGLANLAWCRTGKTRVVEVAQPAQPNCFETLAGLSSLGYTRVGSVDAPGWTVDIDSLTTALEGM